MKSEPLDPRQQIIDQVKENKSFKFVGLYKTAAETINEFDTGEWTHNLNVVPKMSSKKQNYSRDRNDDKKRKKGNETVELPDIGKVHSNSLSDANLSPKVKNKKSDSTVKSIMKNKTNDMSVNEPDLSLPKSKPKKRSKSVSFVLEVTAKKSKSNKEETSSDNKYDKDKSRKELNKYYNEVENSTTDKSQKATETVNSLKKKKIKKLVITNSKLSFEGQRKVKVGSQKKEKAEEHVTSNAEVSSAINTKVKVGLIEKEKVKEHVNTNSEEYAEEKRKVKKAKKFKPPTPETVTTTEHAIDDQTIQNKKKKNKKKRKAKSSQESNTESEEPVVKAFKKELKPEVIVKDLQNLNIGDNPNTLSNLLDEMTVVDKNKKKKHKQNNKKDKKSKRERPDSNAGQNSEEENKDDTVTEIRETLVWKNRKWNKDRKLAYETAPKCAVVVDNLPLKIMCSYKPLLAEHFNKFGTIAGIGVAEAFPNEDPNPVFTTTIYFKDSDAAVKALEEDNTLFQGNRIRVRLPHPPKDTTIVLRAYAEMTDQAISSIFSSAGRIRNIRHLVKGKKSIATAFVEFDGPEAVEQALNLALETKINGKKMYAARYENRNHSKHSQQNKSTDNDNHEV